MAYEFEDSLTGYSNREREPTVDLMLLGDDPRPSIDNSPAVHALPVHLDVAMGSTMTPARGRQSLTTCEALRYCYRVV